MRPTGHIMALHCLENRVYDLKLENDAHVVVKFYRPGRWTRAQVLEEHAFLLDLRKHEIPVCAPLVLSDGETCAEALGMYYAVWPRAGGRSPDELDDGQLRVLGRLLARIHNIGATGVMQHRPRLTSMRFIDTSLEELDRCPHFPPGIREAYREAAETLADIYDDLAEDVPWLRIHGDCHLGNLLKGPEGWFFLDFDDSLVGPAVQDLWLMIGDRGAVGEARARHLLEGYRQFRDFDDRWLALIEPLRGLRIVSFSAWIARRWSDPAFPSSFPEFPEETYWVSELQRLREQVELSEGLG